MKHLVLMSILGTLLFAACGTRNDEEQQAKRLLKLKNAEDINGSWLGDCVANPDKNLPAKMIRIHYTFRKSNFIERHYSYETSDCSGEALYFLVKSGTFSVLEPRKQDDPGEAREINLRRATISLTPNTGAFVDRLRTNNTCGVTDWAIGRPSPVGGVSCWGVIAYPINILYNIFTLADDDKKLCFGKVDDPVNNGSRTSLRPRAIGPCYESIPSDI